VETHYLKGMMGKTILTGEFKFLKIDLSESFRNRKTWEKKVLISGIKAKLLLI
jgi:hypothetical protein